MPAQRQLDAADVMFVAGETPAHYQHIALLIELRGVGRRRPDLSRIRAQCIARLAAVPKLRWKLQEVPFGMDRPYWIDDPDFRCERHVHAIAVPHPGDARELAMLVAQLYCHPLDRDRPLWGLWIIEGLQDRRVALLLEFHHCLMDGVGALKLLGQLCDGGPTDAAAPPVRDAAGVSTASGAAGRSLRAVMNLARMPGSVSRAVYNAVLPRVMEQLDPASTGHTNTAAPTVYFNGELSRDRAFVFGALPLGELKRLKARFGVTLNDLLLALVASAVREALLARGELPEEPLRATIPVSIRHGEDADFSNRVTNITATLATHLDDPLARLRAISEDCSHAKDRAQDGSPGMIELFQALPPLLIGGMMASLPAERAPQILGSNLVVSNVRGTTEPMHIAGARLAHMYPMSILTAAMGINVTCASLGDTLDVGITVDPRMVSEPWALLAGIEAALAHYARIGAAAGGPKSARRRTK